MFLFLLFSADGAMEAGCRLVGTAAAATCRSSVPSSRFHSLRRAKSGVVAAAALVRLRRPELRMVPLGGAHEQRQDSGVAISQKNRPVFFFTDLYQIGRTIFSHTRRDVWITTLFCAPQYVDLESPNQCIY